MAFTLQYPATKINWQPLLIGPQGIGKDSLIEPLKRGLGPHNCVTVSPAELAQQWTFYVEYCLAIFEEVNQFEKRDFSNRVKPLFAAPPSTVTVNKKFQAQYSVPNLTHYILFSNYDDAMALDDDDRRLFVYRSPHPAIDDMDKAAVMAHAKFFDAYYKWLDTGGAEAVVYDLLHRDLNSVESPHHFNPGGRAPYTEAKREMVEQNRSPAVAWLLEGIENRSGPFSGRLTTVQRACRYFDRFAPPHVKRNFSEKAVLKAFKLARAQKLPRVDLASGQTEKRANGDGRRPRDFVTPWSIADHATFATMTPDELRAAYLSESTADDFAPAFGKE
jgi:hypothetical protein